MLASQAKLILSLFSVSCIIGYLTFAFFKIRHRPIRTRRFLRYWLFCTYLVMIICLTILPLPGPGNFLSPEEPYYVLTPFNFLRRIYSYLLANPPWTFYPPIIGLLFDDILMQPVLNILLFVPLGFYLRRYTKWSMIRVLLMVFIVSLTVELLQLTGLLFFYDRPYRLFEVDDLLTNTLGGLGGILISRHFTIKHNVSNLIE
ncbi:hypothetical protein FC84_GL000748 [Lapidilactobacillus dextrinicus DSM 20335]|uniref:VanZ-like domain-containing protein n=1 Tax=Lapidilactobacillus dextrinicus DSM 20335 TaxID=1423738 RepID=A0A0R2BQQ0_9LACO|nr:VanZ family protein [Lapidilactobacillus dextrinicus]KRM78491.1 hypothetical protein FC84_GL000748 [Lapidilactobacillus dextrinicus DSM 20335]QFG46181.1 VanZ family protein [Lapidilactobacillus dextrinicus]